MKFYKDWVENVKNYVPNDRLLVFDVKEGWVSRIKIIIRTGVELDIRELRPPDHPILLYLVITR